jgi:predicted nucleic acid-binding protein
MPDLPVYLLDSYTLLAYLGGEPGAERLQELLELSLEGRCRLCLCHINLGEVLYITERHRGLDKAQSVLALLESLPLEFLEASRDLVLDAAHIKAVYPLSYADAFVVAAARRLQAVVLTGDPEFTAVQQLVKVEWLVKV